MRLRLVVSASVVAIALALAIGSATVAAESTKPDGVKPAPATPGKSVSAAVQFATLKGIKAVPMAASELDAVKGLHIHFVTPSENDQYGETGLQLVNRNNESNYGNGQALEGSGPGYSGLCGAALNSPAIFIPGQNPATGAGAGC